MTWEEVLNREFSWGIKIRWDCHLTSNGILLPPITNILPE
jgi:hypothetical protein